MSDGSTRRALLIIGQRPAQALRRQDDGDFQAGLVVEGRMVDPAGRWAFRAGMPIAD